VADHFIARWFQRTLVAQLSAPAAKWSHTPARFNLTSAQSRSAVCRALRAEHTQQRSARPSMSSPAPPADRHFQFGPGLGGLFDGIVLHQVLQWHHMLSSWYSTCFLPFEARLSTSSGSASRSSSSSASDGGHAGGPKPTFFEHEQTASNCVDPTGSFAEPSVGFGFQLHRL